MTIKIRIMQEVIRLLRTTILFVTLGLIICIGTFVYEKDMALRVELITYNFNLERSFNRMCTDGYNRLQAKINWFVARRSGWREVERMNSVD